MRTVGVGALGLLGGVLLALVVQDVLATTFLQDGTIPRAVAIILGLLIPALGLAGLAAAILFDGRSAPRSKDPPDP